MKASGASAAGLILATGQYHIAALYEFACVQPSATTFYWAAWDSSLTVGGHTYTANMHIRRGPITQRTGVEVQTLELQCTPQADRAAILVGGVPFLEACRLGFLDGCRVTMKKLIMSTAGDVTPGAVTWFQGRAADVRAGRVSASITVESDLALLRMAMPRNIIQTGCTHRLFDAGCMLNPASWQVSGAVSTVASDRSYITSGLSQANDYFSLGVLTFTAGPLSGLSFGVKSYANAGGKVTFLRQLPIAPVAGNTFTITPGCDKRQATCSGKFSNLAHFRGYPYVPVPETIYAGGTLNPPAEHVGGQNRNHRTGSATSGNRRSSN